MNRVIGGRRGGRAGALVGVVFFFAPLAWGESLVQVRDRLMLDWGAMKIRFFGESPPAADFPTAERQAWSEGSKYGQEAVAAIHAEAHAHTFQDPDQLKTSGREAGKSVARSTYSRNTIYYGDGRVAVELESSLSAALAPVGLEFGIQDPPDVAAARNSGIVLKIDGPTRPTAIYRVVNRSGTTLFSVHQVAEKAFAKGLMGRWYVGDTGTSDFAAYIGSNPTSIEGVQAKGPGVFVVEDEAWRAATEGNEPLLASARIALVHIGKPW